jgi:hypothetical protein
VTVSTRDSLSVSMSFEHFWGEGDSSGFIDGMRKDAVHRNGGGGETADAFGPRAEFHSPFQVDSLDDHVRARGQVPYEHVQGAAFPGTG